MAAPGPVTAADAGPAGPLKLAALREAHLQVYPWRHAILSDTITDRGSAQQLARTFPTTGFRQASHHGEDKQFVTEVRNDLEDLTGLWPQLLQQVTSAAYRAAMEDLTGLDLGGAELRVACWRYGPQCWLSPHPDTNNRYVTHVIYANESWPDNAGGRLLIHGSRQVDDVHAQVHPVVGTSVVIVRSSDSWHSVQPVAASHDAYRHSITAVFHKPGADLSYYDA